MGMNSINDLEYFNSLDNSFFQLLFSLPDENFLTTSL